MNVYTMDQMIAELAIPLIHAHELEDGFHCSPVLPGFRVFELEAVPNTVAELLEFGEVRFQNKSKGIESKTVSVFYSAPDCITIKK